MKIFISYFLLLVSTSLFSQNADALIGTYMTDKNEGMVEITKERINIMEN